CSLLPTNFLLVGAIIVREQAVVAEVCRLHLLADLVFLDPCRLLFYPPFRRLCLDLFSPRPYRLPCFDRLFFPDLFCRLSCLYPYRRLVAAADFSPTYLLPTLNY